MSKESSLTPADAPADTKANALAETGNHANQKSPMETSTETVETVFAAADESAELSGDVGELQQEVGELKEQILRRAAEFQNYRRRTESELAQATRRGREEVILAILDVFDDMRRSLGAAEKAANEEETGPAFDALNDGVQLVFKKFTDALVSFGVEPIQAVGHPFDEAVHEAVMQQPAMDDDTVSGTVLAEIQPGYQMGGRILRHARVVVAE